MNKTKVLIVDDEKYIRETLRIILRDAGYEVVTASGGIEALGIVRSDIVDIVLTDYRMPEMNGVALMEAVYKLDPTIVTVIMSAYSEIRPAVEALKHGAFDYIEKVFSNEELLFVVSRANEKRKLLEENRILSEDLQDMSEHGGIVARSAEMKRILYTAKRVAQTSANVLITGESGVGKDVIANLIHDMGPRSSGPFIAVNCGAIPENLMEAELFGYEEGAYTGAVKSKKGKFELADGGTLFLDEIGDLSLQMQVKLLRFLQEKTFSRVGSNRELHADVRFIAATSRNLEELMAASKFREDLYYRLNIFPIVMPDLSKRKGDVMLLAEHFLSKFNLKYGKDIKRLSTPAINMLMAYHWPGNVRELENCMERAVITAQDDCIYGYNLPASLQMPSHDVPYSRDGEAPADLPTMVDSFERELIVAALKRSPGNMSAAARELGISPRVLHYKMHRLGLQKS